MSEDIVVRIVAEVDEAERRIEAYRATAEKSFGAAAGAATRSSETQRAAFRDVGRGVSAFAHDMIAGKDAFVSLSQHSIQTAAALEKFGGTIGKVGSVLSGPWGVIAQVALPLLGQLAARLLENRDNAEAAGDAARRFAERQTDIGRFIDLTTGELIEQNGVLVQNEILLARRSIAASRRAIGEQRGAVAAAMDEFPTQLRFVAERQPFAKVLDPDVIGAMAAAGGDDQKLIAKLTALGRRRPELQDTIDKITAATAAIVRHSQQIATEERRIRGLSGDRSAFAASDVQMIEARAARAAARTPLDRAEADLEIVRLGRAAAAAAGGDALKRYGERLAGAMEKVAEAQAASLRHGGERDRIVPPRATTAREPAPAEVRAAGGEDRLQIDSAGIIAPSQAAAMKALWDAAAASAAAFGDIDVEKIGWMDPDRLEAVARISAKLSNDLAQGLADAVVSGKSLGDVLVDSFARAGAALLQSKIMQLFDPKGDGSSGLLGELTSAFGIVVGALKLPGRASGGHVSAGHLYRVNEAGIEGFRPAGSGSIVPLGRMAAPAAGGSVTIVQPLNLSFAGAITTPELMAEFKTYADSVGQAAILGGAAMAQARLRKQATRSLPR